MYSKKDPLHFAQPTATSTPTIIVDIAPAVNMHTSDGYVGDWKTCRNERYGYEFMYPPHWELTTVKQTSTGGHTVAAEECEGLKNLTLMSTTTGVSSECTNGQTCLPTVFISFSPYELDNYSNHPALDYEYLTDYLLRNSRYPGNSITREYHVNGERWLASSEGNPYSCLDGSYDIDTIHYNEILRLRTNDVSDVILNEILATFKFLK
jgi:hypothetical protein